MKIYKFYAVVFGFLFNNNSFCGCSGEEQKQDIKLQIHKIEPSETGAEGKYFVEYNDGTCNKQIRENYNKKNVEDNFYIVKCDNYNYFNDIILMSCKTESMDNDEVIYKIIYLKDYTSSKEVYSSKDDFEMGKFKLINLFDKAKDDKDEKKNKYILTEIGEEYFTRIKENKKQDICTKDNLKFLKNESDSPIDVNAKSDNPGELTVLVPERLLKSKK